MGHFHTCDALDDAIIEHILVVIDQPGVDRCPMGHGALWSLLTVSLIFGSWSLDRKGDWVHTLTLKHKLEPIFRQHRWIV